jgi:hypothetical protein
LRARGKPETDTVRWPLLTHAADVEAAIASATDPAGGKDVLVHATRTARLALAAVVLDEPEIHQIPARAGPPSPRP